MSSLIIRTPLVHEITFVEAVIREYDCVMDSVEIGYRLKWNPYIPNFYDLVGAIPDDDHHYGVWDIQNVLTALNYFYRDRGIYRNIPVKEVW